MEKRAQVKVNKKGGVKTKVQKLKAGMLKTYYGNPIKDMKLIAITGVTGKTVVAHFVHEILKASGEQVAVLASDQPFKIGTLHKFLSDMGHDVEIINFRSVEQKEMYHHPIRLSSIEWSKMHMLMHYLLHYKEYLPQVRKWNKRLIS